MSRPEKVMKASADHSRPTLSRTHRRLQQGSGHARTPPLLVCGRLARWRVQDERRGSLAASTSQPHRPRMRVQSQHQAITLAGGPARVRRKGVDGIRHAAPTIE
eukprot:scaffold153720_cov31-Tisochrysis_lutea.AAC.4